MNVLVVRVKLPVVPLTRRRMHKPGVPDQWACYTAAIGQVDRQLVTSDSDVGGARHFKTWV